MEVPGQLGLESTTVRRDLVVRMQLANNALRGLLLETHTEDDAAAAVHFSVAENAMQQSVLRVCTEVPRGTDGWEDAWAYHFEAVF